MEFQIFFTAVCLIAAVAITAIIVTNNRDMYGKTPLGWWIVGVGLSQICIVGALAVWWKEWWIAHQWLMNVSTGIAIAAVVLWVVAKINSRRY